MIKIVEQITTMNLEAQNQRLRLFAKVDLEIKLKILEHQKQQFHKLKQIYSDTDNVVLTLASLILAVNLIIGRIDDVNLNAIKIRGSNVRNKVKRQKVLGHWAIVRTLKLEQNMSYRDIATYFAKYHKLEVSHSTIYAMWTELEKNFKIEEN
jgi:hypothetical protein